jgi:DNA repair exonuclease SbcCD ATPase subunit
MARSYEDAVATLYQAPLAGFVAERKRLVGELRAAGDKAGALQLAKLTRPSAAAWVVNQLWWTAQGDFDALFAAARRLREGDLSRTEAYRDAIATLRARATTLLAEANQAASEATLRRVAATLSALAAAGSFAPDAPGRLTEHRDAPGFEGAGILQGPARPLAPPDPRELEEARRQREVERARQREAAEVREREAAERRRLEEQRAQRRAERERLERSLRSLGSEIERRARETERLRRELTEAETELEQSRSRASQMEARLNELRDEK